MATSHSGFFLQSGNGNFEVVVPRVGGGVAHWWRNNGAAGFPWNGPTVAFGSEHDVGAVSLIESSFGHLELIAREGNSLFHNWRDDGGTWRWQKRTYLPGPSNVVGTPALIQSSHGGNGNFEVVAPLAGGGLAHWWRDNDDPSWHWWGPNPFGSGNVEAVAMLQSAQGKLELVARVGDQLVHYWRDDGATWAWHGPFPVADGVAGNPAIVQSTHGANGNFEVVVPILPQGLAHLARVNDLPGTPWTAPSPITTGQVDAVGLIQSSFDKLEIVTLTADHLAHAWRDDGGTWAWHGPHPFATDPPFGDPSVEGANTIPYTCGVVGIHCALMRNGKLAMFAFSDTDGHEGMSGVLDSATGALQQPPHHHHLFCSGHTFLADGTLLVAGGHFHDLNGIHTLDPDDPDWHHPTDMANGRWYPTATTLPDGKVIIMSGTKGNGGPIQPGSPVNNTIEIYDPAPGGGVGPELAIPSPFSAHFPPGFNTIDLYPFVYVLPDGWLLVHSRNTTRFYDPSTNSWDSTQLPNQWPFSRTYPGEASSVLLPLMPDSSPPYRVRVVIFGGGGVDPAGLTQFTPATNTVELLDLGDPNPGWRFTSSMSAPRVMPDAVLLPDGTVLVVGGSAAGMADWGIDPVFTAELFDPTTESWSTLAPTRVPRLYHASAILLPDARVLMAGKDGLFNAAPYDYPEHRIEIFSPPYLFRGLRPTITGAPTSIGYDSPISVQSPQAASITSVVLMRPGSVTHSFNMEQRLVGLTITGQSAGTVTVQSPPNANVAPPGYYMLFLLNGAGVPSIAHFIQLT